MFGSELPSPDSELKTGVVIWYGSWIAPQGERRRVQS